MMIECIAMRSCDHQLGSVVGPTLWGVAPRDGMGLNLGINEERKNFHFGMSPHFTPKAPNPKDVTHEAQQYMQQAREQLHDAEVPQLPRGADIGEKAMTTTGHF